MNLRIRISWKYFLMYVCLFDMCLLPMAHILGIQFKISFMICVLWFLGIFLKMRLRIGNETLLDDSNNNVPFKSRYGKRLFFCIIIIIFTTVLGELTLVALTNVIDISGMRNQMFGYFCLLAFMGIGYGYYSFNKNFMVIILFVYCAVNILLSALRLDTPFLIRYLYGMVGEEMEAAAFTLRITGILGNPNATLSLMNCIFMSIIVFYIKNLIEITSVFKLLLIMIMPMITNCFVNSRGELLVTLFLESVLLYAVLVKQRTIIKRIGVILIIGIMAMVGLAMIWFMLIPRYPTVRYSIERISSTVTMEKYAQLGSSESIAERPFLHADEFVDRFIVSPLWGTGIDSGKQYPFIRGSARYHNDWFGIFASSGIVGGMALAYMVYLAVRKCGLFYICPFIVTAITNTFLSSYYAIGIYFMTVMIVCRYDEMKERGLIG